MSVATKPTTTSIYLNLASKRFFPITFNKLKKLVERLLLKILTNFRQFICIIIKNVLIWQDGLQAQGVAVENSGAHITALHVAVLTW